jgi:hypothetical protein
MNVAHLTERDFFEGSWRDPNALRSDFDIVSVGGLDAAACRLNGFTQKIVNATLLPFSQSGGTPVFVHDTMMASSIGDW